MNENVSIKEGNITRKFAPIDKVKVDNTDGTQSIWVPEDDLKTGVLYASDNGIYIASEDGYDAYSEVVIRVEKRIDDGDLIDESDTDWKDIDFDGDIGNFDELDNWDVDTLEEFSDDLEGFDDLFNDEDKWDEEKEKPITEDEMDDFDGDSISGIDPETGNEMEVSLDEDGFLDEEVLPSSISIIREPFKLKYMDGDLILFAGLVVQAYTEDGNVWTDAGHPDGIIPLSELYFPVKTACMDGEDQNWWEVDGIGTVRLTPASVEIQYDEGYFNDKRYYHYIYELSASAPVYYYKIYDGERTTVAYVSTEPFTVKSMRTHPLGWSDDRATRQGAEHTYNGHTAYVSPPLTGGGNLWNLIPASASQGDIWNDAVLAVTTGEKIKSVMQTVPVQYIRDDGETLEDSYQIEVFEKESGGDSGASWDGNISYGGNDYMLNPNSVVGLSYNPESKKVIAPNIGEYKVDQAIDVGLLIPKEE